MAEPICLTFDRRDGRAGTAGDLARAWRWAPNRGQERRANGAIEGAHRMSALKASAVRWPAPRRRDTIPYGFSWSRAAAMGGGNGGAQLLAES